MIRNYEQVRQMEDEFLARENLSHAAALRLCEAMWAEGVLLGVLPPADLREGLEVDLRVARVLNSCSRDCSSA